MAKLTPKQSRFIEEYCRNGFNATQAAKDAGYSAKTAYSVGNENLSKPDIKQAIDAYKEKVAKSALCDTEWVVKALVKEAKGQGDDTASSRTAALKVLSEFTGGFDANKHKHEVVQMSHEEWASKLS